MNDQSTGFGLHRALGKYVAVIALVASGLTVGLAGVAAADTVSTASTVVATTPVIAANGTTTTTVTVTLAGGNGATDMVSLAGVNANSSIINSGAAGASVTEAATANVATFTVKDATGEAVTYQATDVTDSNEVVAQTATVTFEGTVALTPVANTYFTYSALNQVLYSPTPALAHAGDVLVFWAEASTGGTTSPATSIASIAKASGTGAIGTPVSAIAYTGTQIVNEMEIWYIPITTAGTIALNITWSGTTTGDTLEYSSQEFQPATPATYSKSSSGSKETTTASTALGFPTLTSTAGELYVGFNNYEATDGITTAPTSGYTVEITYRDEAIIYNASTTAASQSPTATADVSSLQSAVGALLEATSTSSTVNFNNNGGTGSLASETDATSTALTHFSSGTMAKTGFTFTGWNTAANGSGTPYADGATYSFSSSTTLYAQWTATDTITYNSEGGSAVANSSGANGTTITLPAAPTYAGYVFNGWFVAATGGTALTSPYTLTGSLTLYAQWTANATDTVAFNSEGGSAVANATGPNGSAITLPTAPTYPGYVFKGWFVAATGGTALTSPYTLTGSLTLYAQWTANATDTVAFNSEGGSAVANATGPNGSAITLPTAPTYSGYTFNGWFVAATGGTALTSPYTLTGSLTLYAQWTVNSGGGGGGGGSPITLTVKATGGSVSFGTAFTAASTVSAGLATGDSATVSTAAYKYAGTGSTTYASSTTAPTAVGTYSVTPSAATVAITPATDASKYATTYTYVAGTLTITTVALTVVAANLSITVGGTVSPSATVLGTVGSDTAAVSSATYTYAGTGSTTYASSATAPTAAGTYSVTPTAATVAVTPSADAGDYSTTYTYVAGTLTITAKAKVKPPVVLHASRIIGSIISGSRRSVTIVGTGFNGKPKITGTTKGIKVSVSKDTGTRLTVWVTVLKGTHSGRGTFTIHLSSGKTCKIAYNIK